MKYETDTIKKILSWAIENGASEEVVAGAYHEMAVITGKETPDGSKNRPVKLDFQLDTFKGDITINLLEMIENLSPEEKQDLVEDGGWWSFISGAMVKEIRDGLASKTFNNHIFELRQAFLQSDVLPEMLKLYIREIIREAKWVTENTKGYEKAYWEICHSSFCSQDTELENFVKGVKPKNIEHEPFKEEIVSEVVRELFEKYGLYEKSEEILRMEKEMLEDYDPEAVARAVEREENRRRYNRCW